MVTKVCRIGNHVGLPCGKPAAFRVYWVQTAEDEVLACAIHLARAVRQTAVGRGAHEVIKVQAL